MSDYYQQEEARYQSPFKLPGITWAVRWIMLLTIGIFVVQLILHIPFGTSPVETPGGNPIWWFSFQPVYFWLPWKFISYMFLHASLMHLFFNMLWLYFFGPEVERALGSRGFLYFYIICGAAAVSFTMPAYVLDANQGDIPIVGASGAIMAVLVAFAMINPDRQIFLFPLPFPITARGLVAIVIFMNIIQAMGQTNVSVETHFGGMVAGFLYMKFLPTIMARYRERVIARKPPKANTDKVGEAVDNIFKMEDWKRK